MQIATFSSTAGKFPSNLSIANENNFSCLCDDQAWFPYSLNCRRHHAWGTACTNKFNGSRLDRLFLVSIPIYPPAVPRRQLNPSVPCVKIWRASFFHATNMAAINRRLLLNLQFAFLTIYIRWVAGS